MISVFANKRKRAERLGRRAEYYAALMLFLKGYRPVAMRYKTRLGEIDLIVRRGNLVAMVEVKARNTAQEAVDAVSITTCKRIDAAADLWLSKQRDAHMLSIRFDIVAVVPRRWPTHFKNAF